MRFIKATYHLETKTVEYEAGDGTRLPRKYYGIA